MPISPNQLQKGHTYTLVGIRGKKVTNVEKDCTYKGLSPETTTFRRFTDNSGKTFAYEEYHYDKRQEIDYGYKFYMNNDTDIPTVGETIRASSVPKPRTHSRSRSKTRRSKSKTGGGTLRLKKEKRTH
ncbi:hypothetical protein EBR66_03340 [bacterium]|nr:hypothetical protein [bacterium]